MSSPKTKLVKAADKATPQIETIEPQTERNIAGTFERNVSGVKEVFTDLFKLQVATVIKYEGYAAEGEEHPDTHPSKFSKWEHTHPFRTYDKKGQKVKTSTPIGGHFHVVEWEENPNPNGTPIIKSVSGPMVMGKEKIKGRTVNVPVPINEYDDHTHDVEYVRSSKVSFTPVNDAAQMFIAHESMKGAPIAGVTER